jgi:hypothetical protein
MHVFVLDKNEMAFIFIGGIGVGISSNLTGLKRKQKWKIAIVIKWCGNT